MWLGCWLWLIPELLICVEWALVGVDPALSILGLTLEAE